MHHKILGSPREPSYIYHVKMVKIKKTLKIKIEAMLKEKDLPNVQEIHKMSKESEGAYKTAVNNIIIGIKETTETGRFEYTYWNKLPKSFSSRLTKWLNGLGYKVEFKNFENTGDKNRLGWDIESMEAFIKWH